MKPTTKRKKKQMKAKLNEVYGHPTVGTVLVVAINQDSTVQVENIWSGNSYVLTAESASNLHEI